MKQVIKITYTLWECGTQLDKIEAFKSNFSLNDAIEFFTAHFSIYENMTICDKNANILHTFKETTKMKQIKFIRFNQRN